ncbi:PadR family transcriptional regulator [Micromonospora sp. WMMD558]|uniref:PadR family transcriptional regulator n=1 Tax=unclassified Micromonospora TaxID=2617518 RepID=UPI001E4DD2A4|nr:PadR family transcriptional regulator [Micromonospora sp. WMMC415]
MSLEHAILVSLLEQPACGYELARRFDRSIGRFWTATHQQIYRVSKRMESDEWITAEEVGQPGLPDKKLWLVTSTGRSALVA